MPKKSKMLSNPFSTGGGGSHFEAHVQASFAVLMLTGGFVPCLPCWPINKIKLQGKFAGYDTDDLIVYVENPSGNNTRKMLGQIKHTINITEQDKIFAEVIQTTWNDFNNANLFSKNKDVFALITGPLSATDINDVRTILEWARHAESTEEFFNKVNLANFSSQQKRVKLNAFKVNIQKANSGTAVTDETIFEFLKHFHVLGYDLDIKSGVTLSLLHSLIGQYAPDNAHLLWTQLVDEIQSANQNAGTITLDNLADDLKAAFKPKIYKTIPAEFSTQPLALIETDWSQLPNANELAIVNLIGEWNEQCPADIKVIGQLSNQDYDLLIIKIREILHLPNSPLSLKNGLWHITNRKKLWSALGSRLFDNHLDNFKCCVIAVLTELDPQFELPVNDRFAASIYGKSLIHSNLLRGGMAETLALLGNHADALSNCSRNKPEAIVALATRNILKNADWVLWGSLNGLLPVLSEADPNEFLALVEKTLQQAPCPFDELFSQEGNGITGGNYLTGLLWALENLAWEEQLLVRVVLILGELATHDPGGNWANRPTNSLITILLPWLPQTIAPVAKRQVAIQTLQKEIPEIGWQILMGLLPGQLQMSMGAHKPSWRNFIPENWEKGVTQQEYWEQVSFCSELAVSIAISDFDKLNELVDHLNKLPKTCLDRLLEHLSSESVLSTPEEDRLALWNTLTAFTSKHRRYPNAQWVLDSELIARIETVTLALAPKKPLNLYRKLFSGRDHDLFEEAGNYEEQRQKVEEQRQNVIKELLAGNNVNTILQLAEAVDSPFHVGFSLGAIGDTHLDLVLFPNYLDKPNIKLMQLTNGYIWSRHISQGWNWADDVDKSSWSTTQRSLFLSGLPFTEEAWNRAEQWLGDLEIEYWQRVRVNPYIEGCNMGKAIDKLIKYSRPSAAIDCLCAMLDRKIKPNNFQCVNALRTALTSTEPTTNLSSYHFTEVIKFLQNSPDTNPDDLFGLEWAYLGLLKPIHGQKPKHLENRLATDPAFFCEVIRLLYRSKNETQPEKPTNDSDKAIANNAWQLLHDWTTPPGTQSDGSFSDTQCSGQVFSDSKIGCVAAILIS